MREFLELKPDTGQFIELSFLLKKMFAKKKSQTISRLASFFYIE